MTLDQLAVKQGVKLLSTHYNDDEVSGYVLADRGVGTCPYVTWAFGDSGFYWGGYFPTKSEAQKDFFLRIGATNNKGE
jgi:hypothetical protein